MEHRTSASRASLLDRDEERQLALRLSEDRKAFAELVLNLPFALREIVLPEGPCAAGRRWTVQELETCYGRILELAAELDNRETRRLASRARRLRERVERVRTRLVLSNLGFVVRQVSLLSWRTAPFADLVQEGTLGLIEAIDRFEPQRGCRLSTYAVWWIRRSLSAALRDDDRVIRVPEHVHLRLSELRQVRRELRRTLGRAPTDQELAARVKLPPSKVTDLFALSLEPIPLENFGAADEMPEPLRFLADPDAPDPQCQVIDANLSERIHGAIDRLTSREARVIRLRFGIGGRRRRTLQEIGRLLNVSRERVRQIEENALRKLQLQLRKAESPG